MTNNRLGEVYIERDGKSWRWGQSSYFLRWSGLKQTINTKVIKALVIPGALFFLIVAYFLPPSHDSTAVQKGTPISSPSLTAQSLPIVAPQILTSKPNTISHRAITESYAGAITVYNLDSVSEIPVGSEVLAKLITGATNGMVTAKLVSPVNVDGDSVVPEDTTIYGIGKSLRDRLYIHFKEAIFPSGRMYPISAEAFNLSDKIRGLKGAIVSSKAKKMAIGLGLGFLGGMAQGLETQSTYGYWQPQRPSLGNSMLNGTSQAALEESKHYLDELKNETDVVEVKAGTKFYLIFDEPHKKHEP